MNREWVVDVVARLPQGLMSRAWGWLARRRHPRAGVEALKRTFVAATGIDMREAAEPIGAYASLEELFTRNLKSGARRVDPDPAAVVCPVDGTVGAWGTVKQGTALQVKGRSYPVAKLLGSAAEAARFEGGSYATFYLSPKDYHRIHTPLAGTVARARVIPGALMPVFHESVSRIEELFARNERLITYIDHERAGRFGVVKVGATLVGRISVTYDESLRSNDPSVDRLEREYDPPLRLHKGAELGAFELGSTVVVFFEKGSVSLSGLESGSSVRLGERIGKLRAAASESRPKKTTTGKTKSAARATTEEGAKKTATKKKASAKKKATNGGGATRKKAQAGQQTSGGKTKSKKSAGSAPSKKKPSKAKTTSGSTSTTRPRKSTKKKT